MSEVTEKRIERTVVWLDAGLVPRMDGWLKADNCKNRSEFINKALRFYMGYLGTEDNTAYLSKAILTAIQGTLDDNNNRLCRIIFKWAVELNMMCHTIAAHFRTDPIHTRELRAYAVDEVKRPTSRADRTPRSWPSVLAMSLPVPAWSCWRMSAVHSPPQKSSRNSSHGC